MMFPDDFEEQVGTEMAKQASIARRDRFALRALAALCGRLGYSPHSNPAELAQDAYAIADAMLAERAKGGA